MKSQAARVDSQAAGDSATRRPGDPVTGRRGDAVATETRVPDTVESRPAVRPSAPEAGQRAMARVGRRIVLIEPGADPGEDRQIVRFTRHQRAQHFLMMSSVLTLVFTGMPQKFFDFPLSQWMINLWGGLDSARAFHHLAGFAMIFAALYHVSYLLYTIVVLHRPFPVWMIPNPRDFQDFFQNTAYYLGMAKTRAKFGRFSVVEKFDYWAVFWGVPIMGLTGLILMYPLIVTRFMPGVVVPVATIAHSDEAVLATGWLFVVHFYNAHFAPHIFPFNRSIFTGRVPEKRYAREHPREYDQMRADLES